MQKLKVESSIFHKTIDLVRIATHTVETVTFITTKGSFKTRLPLLPQNDVFPLQHHTVGVHLTSHSSRTSSPNDQCQHLHILRRRLDPTNLLASRLEPSLMLWRELRYTVYPTVECVFTVNFFLNVFYNQEIKPFMNNDFVNNHRFVSPPTN